MARASRVGSSVLDTGLLVTCLILSLVSLFLPVEMRERSAAALRRSVAAPFAELQRRAETSRAAFLSYGDRMERQGEMARLQSEIVALRSENARLRAILGIGSRLDWGFVVAEASPAQFESGLIRQQVLQTFNVTAGARAGIVPFTPVVSAEGLVGMVETVDPTAAIAISYSHPDFRVSATTPNDSAVGIVQAHLGSGTGAARGMLEMRGVPFRSPLKAGQLVISSGLGGTYPRGIPVGTVVREIQTPEKWARTYLLQPAASLANIGPVFLLLKKRSEEGVATVWMTPEAADSAARSVAAAGDSLAREAAMREMAARRAAMDSLGLRDSVVADSLVRTPGDSARPPAAAPRAAAPTTTAPRPTVPAPTL
jgi:rod shape-determining protein MreC